MIKNSFMTGIYDDDYDSCDNEYVDDIKYYYTFPFRVSPAGPGR